MQACEHFNSIETLKQWYEKNKGEYFFMNEYEEETPFEDYLIMACSDYTNKPKYVKLAL